MGLKSFLTFANSKTLLLFTLNMTFVGRGIKLYDKVTEKQCCTQAKDSGVSHKASNKYPAWYI